jgi:hypothetical protein
VGTPFLVKRVRSQFALSARMFGPASYARKRIAAKLDYLGADGAKLIGCLTNSNYSIRQQPDQAAIISAENHLWLHIRGELIDCGLPRSAPDDAQANAATFRWYWPDSVG